MICPRCGSYARNLSRQKRYRPRQHKRGRFRWYACEACGLRFTTIEFPLVTERDVAAIEALEP
jgi:transcriptional regulator NrdR family protein